MLKRWKQILDDFRKLDEDKHMRVIDGVSRDGAPNEVILTECYILNRIKEYEKGLQH